MDMIFVNVSRRFPNAFSKIKTRGDKNKVLKRFFSAVSDPAESETKNEIPKLSFPEPVYDLKYYCDPSNEKEIEENVIRRKSSGNIKTVLELNNLLKQCSPNTDEFVNIEKKLLCEVAKLPNRSNPAVVSFGDKPKIISSVGNKKEYKFKPKDFSELSKHLRVAKSENLSIFTGHRSYFLMGQLVDLESALVQFSLKNLLSKNFKLISVPDILDRQVIEGCGKSTRGKRNQVYALDSEHHAPDLCLSGTAEMAIAGFLMNKVLSPESLPLRLAAVSRCYRAETSRTHEERGIFRVHQFTKVEMFGVCEPEQSNELLEEFKQIEESAFEQLDLHFKVLDMPPFELGDPANRKYDIEAWMPGRGAYGEISSCSNCTDYQSRRLGIRIGSDGKFAHTVNGTACAIPRTIISLMETHQNKDGTVNIPPVLQPFMDNIKVISRNSRFPRILPFRAKDKKK